MSSFVFVCVHLIKGDGMAFATSAADRMCKNECSYRPRERYGFTIITLTVGKRLWEIREGTYLNNTEKRG